MKKSVFLAAAAFVAAIAAAQTSSSHAAADREPPDGQRSEGQRLFLASDALQGRGTPSPGLDIAAEYIAAQFRRAGLDPAGDDGYFQTASYAKVTPTVQGMEFTVDGAGGTRQSQERVDGAAAGGCRGYHQSRGGESHWHRHCRRGGLDSRAGARQGAGARFSRRQQSGDDHPPASRACRAVAARADGGAALRRTAHQHVGAAARSYRRAHRSGDGGLGRGGAHRARRRQDPARCTALVSVHIAPPAPRP